MNPHKDTISLFYTFAPNRPKDELYTKWLGLIRKNRADAIWYILNTQRLLESKDPEIMIYVRMGSQIGHDYKRSAENHRQIVKTRDDKNQQIIQEPDNEEKRKQMQADLDY